MGVQFLYRRLRLSLSRTLRFGPPPLPPSTSPSDPRTISALLSSFLRNTHLWDCNFCTAASASLTLSASTAASHPSSHPLRALTNLHSCLLSLRNTHLWDCRFVQAPLEPSYSSHASSTPLPTSPQHPLPTLTNLHSYLRFLETLTYGTADL